MFSLVGFRSSRFLTAALGAGLIALTCLPLLAQAPPSADTFVSSSTPKVNYGPSIALVVGPGTTSYVRFNLAGIPAGASISKATLRLYEGCARSDIHPPPTASRRCLPSGHIWFALHRASPARHHLR
jgi:hypothetical protein